MIISHRLKWVFIHIPKTGGTSIKHIIRYDDRFKHDVNTGKYETEESVLSKLTTELWAHSNIVEISKYLKDHGYEPKDYFKFAFIRNPWDHTVSRFEYWKQVMCKKKKDNCSSTLWKEILWIQKISFKDFIRTKKFGWIYKNSIFNKHNELLVDFVGRFERLQDDFNIICDKIKAPNVELPCMNKTNHSHYRTYYDNDDIEIVRKQHENIIELGNYKF